MAPEADRAEISELLGHASREVSDARAPGLSSEGSFEHSYTAALLLATVVVRASGERVHAAGYHERTFEALGTLASQRWAQLAEQLQRARRRRHRIVYGGAELISAVEAADQIERVEAFADEVRKWLTREHPELAP